MNLFKTFLEIKTWKIDLTIHSLFLPTTASGRKGIYIEYFYDRDRHSFYINDTARHTKALKHIKEAVNRAYAKELCPLFVTSRDKRPNVFNISLDEKNWNLVISKLYIDIEDIRDITVL